MMMRMMMMVVLIEETKQAYIIDIAILNNQNTIKNKNIRDVH
jgi:hypothetical protein